MLSIGIIVKNFSLPDSQGDLRQLSAYYAKTPVLYFIQKMIRQDVRNKLVHLEINMTNL
jgi:peroxiredoxin